MRGLGTDHVISATAAEYRPANSPIMLFFVQNLFVCTKKNSAKIMKQKKRKCVIAWEYYEDTIQPKVSTTSGRGGFELSQKHRQTYIQTD